MFVTGVLEAVGFAWALLSAAGTGVLHHQMGAELGTLSNTAWHRHSSAVLLFLLLPPSFLPPSPLFFPCPCSFPSPSPFPSSICLSSSPLPPHPIFNLFSLPPFAFPLFPLFPSSFFSFLPSSLSFLSSLFFPDHRATQAPFSLQEAVWEQTPAAVMGTGMPFWGNHLQSPQELPDGTSPVLHKSPWNHGSVLPATEPVLLWLCVGPSTPSAPDVIYSHHCESLFCFEESQGQRVGKGPLKVT